MVGKTLSHYEILEPLGAGGMGEVWLAEDTRLGRQVAVKVLPEEFASIPERLARFEQEARAAAALNHPHIAVVHDIGNEGDTHFMVQEYLEGQSLRERLDKGALPLDKALDLAIEVGEALIAAHKVGIVHRDLKPDNIFVTGEGHAKVLDFGLAKLTEMTAPKGSALTVSPTALGTVAGQIMGTAGYMAPEQVEGEEVDARADLFSLGCVLYEMVAGERAFAGENLHDTLGKIVSGRQRPVQELGVGLPLKLGWIVDKALAKDPGRRYQTAGDLVIDLSQLREEIIAGLAQTVSGKGPGVGQLASPSPVTRALPWALVALMLAGLSYVIWFSGAPPQPTPVAAFSIELPEGTRFTATGRRVLAISPDGREIVFNAAGQLWRRPLSELGEATPVRGTEELTTPFFSPDGTELGFWLANEFAVIPASGGLPRSLWDATMPAGASWADDGAIFYGDLNRGILRGSAAGGTPALVVPLEEGEAAVTAPQLLPGGEWLLFTLLGRGADRADDARIVAQSLSTQERIELVPRGADARYLPTGHLVWVQAGELTGAAFDPSTLQIGTSVSLGRRVQVSTITGSAQYGISDNGVLVYTSPLAQVPRRFVWVDRGGEVVGPLTADYDNYRETMAVAPDGGRVLAVRDDGVWILPVDGRPATRLTQTGILDSVLWVPGENEVVAERAGGEMVRIGTIATGEEPQLIGPFAGHNHPMSWDAQGRLVFVDIAAGREGSTILRVDLDGGEPEDVLRRPYDDGRLGVAVSPDASRVAFVSDSNGTDEVFVMAYPDGVPERVSSNGGIFPVWSSDGSELFYMSRDRMMQVAFDGAGFQESALFPLSGRFAQGSQAPSYAVTEDGRFLMLELEPAARLEDQHINVVLNWFEELKERVPTGQ